MVAVSTAAEAVLLVGGQGTRLRPLTLTVPKPLLPVGGVPFLVHQVCKVRDAGVSHVVLATSYRPEVFVDELGDGSRLGVQITYVEDTVPLGTGGAIRNVADALTSPADAPVVVLNGDILSGHDLAGQVRAHVEHDADVTLHLVEVEDARAFGCVPSDADGRVTAFLEKMPAPVTNWVNAGAYVMRRSVIDAIPTGRPVSVERETFPGLLSGGAHVRAWQETAYWRDLGTPVSYVAGSRDVVLGLVPGAVRAEGQRRDGALVLPGAHVDDGASVQGGSVVGEGAHVAQGAVVDGSVLLAGARVHAGAQVTASVVAERAVVADGCVVDASVVGADAHVAPGNELRAGARLWPGVRLDETSLRFSPDV